LGPGSENIGDFDDKKGSGTAAKILFWETESALSKNVEFSVGGGGDKASTKQKQKKEQYLSRGAEK